MKNRKLQISTLLLSVVMLFTSTAAAFPVVAAPATSESNSVVVQSEETSSTETIPQALEVPESASTTAAEAPAESAAPVESITEPAEDITQIDNLLHIPETAAPGSVYSDGTTEMKITENEDGAMAYGMAGTPISLFASNDINMQPGGTAKPGHVAVSATALATLRDGTAPFDVGSAAVGDDANETNRRVRSFDSAYYTIAYTTKMTSSEYLSFTDGRVYFSVAIKLPPEKATLDTAATAWFNQTDYRYDGSTQIWTGYRQLRPIDGVAAFPGGGTVSFKFNIKAAENNDVLKPVINTWIDGSSAQEFKDTGCIITAAPRYNIMLAENTSVPELTLDFGNGNPPVRSYLQNIGVNVQLYNKTADHGWKGIELPQGEITATIDVSLLYNGTNSQPTLSTPTLFEYLTPESEVGNAGRVGGFGRTVPTTWGSATGNAPVKSAMENMGDFTASQDKNTITVKFNNFSMANMQFPTGMANNNFLPPGLSTAGWNQYIGTFTAGLLLIENYKPTENEVTEWGSGNMNFRAAVTGFSAKSLSQQECTLTNEMNKNDNSVNVTINMVPPGGILKHVALRAVNNDPYTGYTSLLHSGEFRGNSWAYVNREFYVETGWSSGFEAGTGHVAKHAINVLKYDSDAFALIAPIEDEILVGTLGNPDKQVYYGTKADGGSWANDAEMSNYSPRQMIWYTSPGAIPAGQKLAAVAFEYNNADISRSEHGILSRFRVLPGATANNVYSFVSSMESWNFWQIESYGAAPHMDSPAFSTYGAGWQQWYSANPEVAFNFRKAQYAVGNERFIDQQSGYFAGQSLYIVNQTTSVTNGVLQQTNGKAITAIDVAQNERTLDYQINPNFAMMGGGDSNVVRDVIITDTLPVGVRYISGSARQGASYTATGTAATGTINGGTALEPTISTQNGQQVLTWVYGGVKPTGTLPTILFKAEVGTPGNEATDVQDGQALDNVVTITDSGDYRGGVNGQTSTASVRVIKLDSLALRKEVVEDKVEVEQNIVWQLKYDNRGDGQINNVRVLDWLPYDGDSRGSHINGTYSIGTATPISTSSSMVNIDLYYTTDPAIRNQLADKWATVQWTKASFSDGVYTLNVENPTAIMMTGNVPKGNSAAIEFAITPKGNQGGNIYGNNASLYYDGAPLPVEVPTVRAGVVQRSVSGLIWIDPTGDGDRYDRVNNTEEQPQEDIEIALTDLEGNLVKDVTGQIIEPVVTDETGKYQFNLVPAGEFQVRKVSASPYINFAKLDISPKDAPGVPIEFNSNADPLYRTGRQRISTLMGGVIQNISMPSKNDMDVFGGSGNFNIPFRDTGIYGDPQLEKEANPAAGLTPEEATKVLEGQIIEYTLPLYNPGAVTYGTVVDTLPDGVSPVPGTFKYKLHGSTEWVTTDDAIYNPATHTINFEMAVIPYGTSYFSLKVVVNKVTDPSLVKILGNKAELIVDGEVRATSKTIYHKAITRRALIEKTSSAIDMRTLENWPWTTGTESNPVQVERTQIVEYKIPVTNIGDGSLKSGIIEISDQLDPEITFVPGSIRVELADGRVVRQDDNYKPAYKVVHPGDRDIAAAPEKTYQPADKWTEWPGYEHAETVTPTGRVRSMNYSATTRTVMVELENLSKDEEAFVYFSVLAPLTSDNPATTEYETNKRWENQAQLKDVAMEKQIYQEHWISSDGTVVEKDSSICIAEEYTRQSNKTYHVVKEPLLVGRKYSTPATLDPWGFIPVVADGETITYFVELKNIGEATAWEALLHDYIPTGTTYVEGSASDGGVFDAKTQCIHWVYPDIAVGEKYTVSFKVTVNPIPAEQTAIISNGAYYRLPNPYDPNDVDNPNKPDDRYNETNVVLHQLTGFIKFSDPTGGTSQNNATHIKAGQKVTYYMQFLASDGVKHVSVKDKLPKGMVYIPGSFQYVFEDGTVTQVPDSQVYNPDTHTFYLKDVEVPKGRTLFSFECYPDGLNENTLIQYYKNKASVIVENEDGRKVEEETNEVTHKVTRGVIAIDKNAEVLDWDNETVLSSGRGDKIYPIDVEQIQPVKYVIDLDYVAAPEHISGDFVVTDDFPAQSIYRPDSMKATFTLTPGSNARLVESSASDTGVRWVVTGLRNGDKVRFEFTVFAPSINYAGSLIFENTAKVVDKEMEELQKPDGSPVYTEQEWTKISPTTYHRVHADNRYGRVVFSFGKSTGKGFPRTGGEISKTETIETGGETPTKNNFPETMEKDGTTYTLQDVTYKKTGDSLTETVPYEGLKSKEVPATFTVERNGEKYVLTLDSVRYTETGKTPKIDYDYDFGYSVTQPHAAATRTITLADENIGEEREVEVNLVSIDMSEEYDWRPTSISATFYGDAAMTGFKLNDDVIIPYSAAAPTTKGYEKDILAYLSLSPSSYRIVGAKWIDEDFVVSNGQSTRRAVILTEQYTARWVAHYSAEDTKEIEFSAQAVYASKATFEATAVYAANKLSLPVILAGVGVLLLIILAVLVLVVIIKKRKKESSTHEGQ